jgi:hypothetical protein
MNGLMVIRGIFCKNQEIDAQNKPQEMLWKILFLALIAIHGLIHFMGFVKAFKLQEVATLTMDISKTLGIIWLAVGVAFLLVVIGNGLEKQWWPMLAIVSAVISQFLIVVAWQDAKAGTIANVIILLVAIYGMFSLGFKNSYLEDVHQSMLRQEEAPLDIIKKSDIEHLPELIKKYLNYTGAIGKPKVNNMKVLLSGSMRGTDGKSFAMKSEQHNFFDDYERLFFMTARVKGLPTAGYHRFKAGEATMDIRLLSRFPVVRFSGQEMLISETVTVFNDMCLLAPGTLIDTSIRWEEIDSLTVQAFFTHNAITISAVLQFNEEGALINFTSYDRYDINKGKQFPFSTPILKYGAYEGYRLCARGEAVWHYPEGAFTYGEFKIDEVVYNVQGK